MNTLITGASGFTGNALLQKLIYRNEHIRVIVRDKSKFIKTINSSKVEIIEGDIADENVVRKAMVGIDRVFHIAAAFRNPEINDDIYYKTHVDGTRNLLESALSEGVSKFIHCSTVGVHGHIENPLAGENYPFNPGDIYQETKLEGEKLALNYYEKYGLPVVVIRPTPIYGPGDLRLLKLFKLAALKYTPVPGNGEIFFHMVHVDDLINAFLIASKNNSVNGQVFIIGGSERLSLNDLLSMISNIIDKSLVKFHLPVKPIIELSKICERVCKVLDIDPPLYERRIHFFTNSRAFDISKANNLLNFQPRINLLSGITETLNWYVNEGLLDIKSNGLNPSSIYEYNRA